MQALPAKTRGFAGPFSFGPAPVLRTPRAKVRQKYGPCAEETLREELSDDCQLNLCTLQAVNSYTRYCKKVRQPLVNIAPTRLQRTPACIASDRAETALKGSD